MDDLRKCSSLHGVSFEMSHNPPAPHSKKRIYSFDFSSLSQVVPTSGSPTAQRSESRGSSHLCDVDIEANDPEHQADLEDQKGFSSSVHIPREIDQEQPPVLHNTSRKPPAGNGESRLSVILLDQGLFTVYKKLFLVCFALNVTGLVLAVTGHFPYAKKEATLFSMGNILALVLSRNEAFLRCLFCVAVKVLSGSWVPLSLKTATTSFLQCVGGIHSGCGVSSIMWLIYSLVETLRHRETTSHEIISVAAAILGLLMISSIGAFPLVRHLHHNVFEGLHRFAGWTALALLWAFVILTASYNPADKSYHVRGSALAKKQEFWFTLVITLLIILPWLTIRKVPVQVSAPSGHASIIKFSGGFKRAFLGGSVDLLSQTGMPSE